MNARSTMATILSTTKSTSPSVVNLPIPNLIDECAISSSAPAILVSSRSRKEKKETYQVHEERRKARETRKCRRCPRRAQCPSWP